MSQEIQSAQLLELQSLSDLVRLVVSRFDPGNRATYLYYAEKDGKHVFFNTQVVFGWYDRRGLPITLVAYHDEAPTNLIRYISPTDSEVEKWEFVTTIENQSNIAHIPIIRLASVPSFLL